VIRAYLDNNATTKPASAVVEAMMPYLTDLYLNPSSVAGKVHGADSAIPSAKRAIATLMGNVDLAPQFVLTSGASEANSWVFDAATRVATPRHIVISAIEHPSVLAAARAAAGRGHRLDIVSVDRNGLVEVDALADLLMPETALVSIMLANNETGAIQPMERLTKMIRSRAPAAWIHSDMTQAVGKIPIDLEALDEIDLVSLSAHKFHGPKGMGALFIRDGLTLEPLVHGEQEDGMRGGTLNAAAAAGLASSADIAGHRLSDMERVEAQRNTFESRLMSGLEGVSINAKAVRRLPNTSSITIDGVDANDIVDMLAIRGICIASGSACSAGSDAPSHVLTAMGLPFDRARSTIRISLSRETTDFEIELVLTELVDWVVATRQEMRASA
jgi:cysteine desulfurase